MLTSKISPLLVLRNDRRNQAQQAQFEQACEQLRHQGDERTVRYWETLLWYARSRQYSGVVGLRDGAAGPDASLAALAALLPCDMVSQWASRHSLLLLLPIYARSPDEQRALFSQACKYVRAQQPRQYLGLLTFSFHSSQAEQCAQQGFVEAWNYVITVSLPLAEEEQWLLPLQEQELHRYGGEVDLPRELAGFLKQGNL